jgi:hypothetical protein
MTAAHLAVTWAMALKIHIAMPRVIPCGKGSDLRNVFRRVYYENIISK